MTEFTCIVPEDSDLEEKAKKAFDLLLPLLPYERRDLSTSSNGSRIRCPLGEFTEHYEHALCARYKGNIPQTAYEDAELFCQVVVDNPDAMPLVLEVCWNTATKGRIIVNAPELTEEQIFKTLYTS